LSFDEVVAAQVGVAVGGLDLDHPLADLEHRDVEGTATEVIDDDGLVLLLVETISQRSRRRLVDDARHLETRDLPGVFGRLALRVVEVGRHCDDSLVDLLTEILLGGVLHLLEDHRGDLGRRHELAAFDLDAGIPVRRGHDLVRHQARLVRDLVVAASHEPLDGVDGVLGIGDGLALGDLADEAFAVLGECHHRRRRAATLGVGDDDGCVAFHDRHDRVGRAQIDTYDLAQTRTSCDSSVEVESNHVKSVARGNDNEGNVADAR
jgi:hypothetical protein